MITITSEPPLLNLQGLPLVYKVSSNMFDEPYFKIMAEPVAGQYELLPLNAADEAVFDLREYFKPELSVELKLAAHLHANACKPFEVVFHEYYGNPPAQYDNNVSTIVVLLGTVPRWKQAAFNAAYGSFTTWFVTNIFLSWYPAIAKKLLPTQPELLYFMAPTNGTFSPTVVITYSDGTTANHSPAISISAQIFQVASLPVGYTELGIAAVTPAKTAVSYTVTIGGKTRSYAVDHTPYRDVRYIIFRNSLGGYDTLACTGEADEATEMQREVAERVYDPEHPGRLNKLPYNIEHTPVVKVNSGWLLPAERDWLNDLLISEDVYELAAGILSPVLIRNTSIDRTKRTYEPGSVELEYEYLSIAE